MIINDIKRKRKERNKEEKKSVGFVQLSVYGIQGASSCFQAISWKNSRLFLAMFLTCDWKSRNATHITMLWYLLPQSYPQYRAVGDQRGGVDDAKRGRARRGGMGRRWGVGRVEWRGREGGAVVRGWGTTGGGAGGEWRSGGGRAGRWTGEDGNGGSGGVSDLEEARSPVKVQLDVLDLAVIGELVDDVVLLGLLVDVRDEEDPALDRCNQHDDIASLS